ncbi:MAG: hypothetical protein Q9209_005681 [Squamulea sp. 1 TL-2023]
MGRELQKKKNKSSIPKVKHKPKSKKLNLKANPIVAANWNKTQTLSQNYRRLGLVSKLNARAGRIEIPVSNLPPPGQSKEELKDSLAIANVNTTTLVPGKARIVRDEKGDVVRVVHDGDDGGRKREREWRGRKLVDVLGSGSESEGEVGGSGQHDLIGHFGGVREDEGGEGMVVQLLAKQASITGEKKRPRKQSQREEEWLERLVEKYGDDVGAMVRDRKLNPMQQSQGDIGRRIRMWREGRRKHGSHENADMDVG